MSIATIIQTSVFCLSLAMGFLFTLFMLFAFIGIVPGKLMVSLSIFLGVYLLTIYANGHWPVWLSFILCILNFGIFAYLCWLVVVKRLLKEIREENKRKLEM